MAAFQGLSLRSPSFSSLSPPSPWPKKGIALCLPSQRRLRFSVRITAQQSNPRGDALSSAISFVKPACIALVAGAAFFLAGLRKPPPALSLSVQSETLLSQSPDLQNLPDEEKMKILEEHLQSNPDDIKVLRSLMELKITSQNTQEAIAIVDRLIDLENDQKDLPLLKSHLQIYQGDAEAAKLGFEEMLRKDPQLVEAYHGLVMADWHSESRSDLEAVLERIKGAMEICENANDRDCLRDFKLLVAQVKIVQGKYDEALKVYNDLVKEEPKDFRPYLCQGIVYSMLQKKDEAEKQFHKYRQLVPEEHPYSQYFDENMIAMKVFSQIEEEKRTASASR